MNRTLNAIAALTAATLLTLGAAQAASPVVVSSKIDTEGSLLGRLILQRLDPEYTGNGAFLST